MKILIFVSVKKIVIIFILFFYTVATVGATIHLHYCMNEYVGWSLWEEQNGKGCDKCGMKESAEGCCKDEHKHIQLKVDQQKSVTSYKVQFFDYPAECITHCSPSIEQLVSPICIPGTKAPPDISERDLYILHCVFTI